MKRGSRRRLTRAAAAGTQVLLAGVLVGGLAWAAGQPAVVERIDGVDVKREGDAIELSGSLTVGLEQAVLSCPGPELVGLAGARDLSLTTRAFAVAAPLEELADLPMPQGAPALDLSVRPAPPAGAEDAADDDTDDDAADDEGETSVHGAALEEPTGWFATASGTAAPGFVATQETLADVDEAAGLATVPCQRSGPQAWVIGGGGGPGRAERLVLTNPGSNPVTVDITAYGAEGATSPPDAQGLVVPAQGRTVLLGDALAPDEESPAFAISASGGDVSAALVEVGLDGTRPTGFDVVAPTAPPAEQQIIPGVLIPDEGAGSALVRIVNPGEDEVIATISALTATGELPLPDAVARVAAGAVTDVPLEGVPEGITSLAVRADAPVAAAVRTVVEDGSTDAAWAVSQARLSELAGAAVPARDGFSRLLVLAASGSGASVEVIQGSAATSTSTDVLVPTDASVVFPLNGDGVWVVQVDGTGEVYASVLTTGDDVEAVSSMPLTVPPTMARRSEVVPLP